MTIWFIASDFLQILLSMHTLAFGGVLLFDTHFLIQLLFRFCVFFKKVYSYA